MPLKMLVVKMAHKYSDLGETEIVNKASLHLDHHIEALENRVDILVEENKALRAKLTSKPSAVTQEDYDDLCRRYQMECLKNIPF